MSNPLLDLITQGESGTAGYNAYNRGTYTDADGKSHIRSANAPIDFSQMTLGEVLDRQHAAKDSPDKLLAVGKYQIIPETMSEAARKLSLDRNQLFTPELQDEIFSQHLVVNKRPAVHDYIAGNPGATLHEAQVGMASEWASFGDPNKDGASHYPPPNHASITLGQSANALNQMRTEYQADIAKGMTPTAAWNAVTASDDSPSLTHPVAHHANHAHAVRPGILIEGDHGAAVHKLQGELAHLGYTDATGKPLKVDGDFGPGTHAAVEAFQRDHYLLVDGKVGHDSRVVLDAQIREHARVPGLDNPKNPDHALYVQTLAGVHKLDAQAGRTSDQHSANLAAALVVDAKREGLTRIDTVALSTDNGARVFAMQNEFPLPKFAEVPTLTSLNTPIDKSTAAVTQVNQQHAAAALAKAQEAPPLIQPPLESAPRGHAR